MNEFNPFDDLGITFDSNDNYNETWRDRNYQSRNSFNKIGEYPSNDNVEPEFQPDFQQTDSPINIQDLKAEQELGMKVGDIMSDEEKQAYVDGLSNDDWKTWNNLKKEGLSFEGRKMLMDNRDELYDINKPGNEKYWSGNKNPLHESLIKAAQGASDFQVNVVHPRTQTAEEWLNVMSQDLGNYSYDEILNELVEKRIDSNDNALVRWLKTQTAKPDAFIKREAAVVGSTLFNAAAGIADGVERLTSSIIQLLGVGVNAFNTGEKGYDMVTWDASKDPSTLLGNYSKIIYDAIGPGFLMKFPLASYLITSASSKSELLGASLEAIMEAPGAFAKAVINDTQLENYLRKYMAEEEYDSVFTDVSMGIWGLLGPKIKKYGGKIPDTKLYQMAQGFGNVVSEMMKRARKEGMGKAKTTLRQVEAEPAGTIFSNKKGKVLFESTADGARATPRGVYEILRKNIQDSLAAGRNAAEWFMKNKDSALVTRDPNKPVGELPIVDPNLTNPSKNIPNETPVKQEAPQEVVNEKPTTNKPKKSTKLVETENQPSESIVEFIKKITNQISGKKGGLDDEMMTKLQTNVDLQNEYINTIDPYLREGGGTNPAGVIEEPLKDFIESVKTQLEHRNNLNTDFRKNQEKLNVQIPESDKIRWKTEGEEIKSLIKILTSKSTDPEKFLQYLYKMKPENIEKIQKYVPEFSKNLGLIKDVLDLTKAITSKDLLGKFLQFKSTWGTRNKNYIRKWIYQKLRDQYVQGGINYNMKEIESILNKLPENKLKELEKAISLDEDLPAYLKQDFIDNLYDKFDKDPMIALEGRKIGDTTVPLGKEAKDKIINKELTNQGYRNQEDKTPVYKTEEKLRKHKFNDGTTVGQWMDRVKANLSPKMFSDLRIKSEADFWNQAIRYNYQGLEISSFVIGHEIAHFLLGKLTTSELFDLTEKIRDLTKTSGKEINRVGMGEYLADTISNYLNHGDVNGLEGLLTKGLDVPKNEITQHIKKVIDQFKDDKLFQDRKPRYENPRTQGGITAGERMDFLRKIDPKLKDYSFDLNPDSSTFSEMRLNLNDGESLSWEERKDSLSHKQYLDLYSSEDLFNLEKEIKSQNSNRKEKLKSDIEEGQAYFGKEKYEQYQKALHDIDPDIVGITEKDGKLYIRLRMESYWERYEMADRPGMVEIHDIPANEFFSPKEFEKLPKDLQDMIKKDAD